MPDVIVRGARFNYLQVESEAEGPVHDLIMVHGLATSLAFWYFQYAHVFARRFRVTLFDLRGHGNSEVTQGGYHPQDLSRDLEELMDALDIRKAHLIAHSYGGVISLGFAAHSPSRVRSLVLADTQLSSARNQRPEKPWPHAAVIQELLDKNHIPLDTRDPFFGYHLLTEMSRVVARGDDLPPELKQLVGPMLGKYGKRTARRWIRLVDDTDAHRQLTQPDGIDHTTLAGLRFPILALYGSRSQAHATSDDLQALWPNAVFRTLDGAGHFFPATRAEEVIAACESFWQPASTSSIPPLPPSEANLPELDLFLQH